MKYQIKGTLSNGFIFNGDADIFKMFEESIAKDTQRRKDEIQKKREDKNNKKAKKS